MDEQELPDAQEHYEAGMEGESAIEREQPSVSPATPTATVQAAPAQAQHKPMPAPITGASTKMQRLKAFYRECVRVFKITKKPDRQEFTTIVKISGAGILVIGAIGFLIHMAQQLLFK